MKLQVMKYDDKFKSTHSYRCAPEGFGAIGKPQDERKICLFGFMPLFYPVQFSL